MISAIGCTSNNAPTLGIVFFPNCPCAATTCVNPPLFAASAIRVAKFSGKKWSYASFGTSRIFVTPESLDACEESDLASLPVRRAVMSPEPSFVAAVTAESEAGRNVLFLCSRMARVERFEPAYRVYSFN